MAERGLNRKGRKWIISLLLMTLALRALVPMGFMPSAQEPFTLEICPDGFPAELLQHRHDVHHDPAHGHHQHGPDGGQHQHDPSRSEHCVFAAAAGIGPAPHIAAAVQWSDAADAPLIPNLPAPVTQHRYYVPPPRGPPVLV